MKRILVASVALAVFLSGCAGPVAEIDARPQSSDKPPAAVDIATSGPNAELLLGTWRVSDAEGATKDTWVRFGDEVTVSFDCGNRSGEWAARDGALIASALNYDDRCEFGESDPVPWLTSAKRYDLVGGELVLLDADGDHLATLTDDGAPPHDESNSDDPFTGDVVMNEHIARSVQHSIPLPGEAVPINSITGKWVPADPAQSTEASVEFFESGVMQTSDGCNRSSGLWALGAKGSWISTSGITTMMACDGMVQVGGIVLDAVVVGMVGQELTFYGANGNKLGALVHA